MTSSAAGVRGATGKRLLPGAAGAGLACLLWATSFIPVASAVPVALGGCVVVVALVGLAWRDGGTTFVRWWARTAGVIAVALLAPMVVGDVVTGHGPPLPSIAGVAFIGLWAVLFVGVAAAFRWEGTAGLALVLAALALQAQVIWGGINPYILVFAAVGLGFVFCWWRTGRSAARR